MASDSSATRTSLLAAVAIVVGNMIGSGVFGSLGFQVAAFPSGFVIMLLWITGGILAFCGAVNYAELAAAFPRSGGEYQLLSRVYHPGVGFVSGWVSMVVGFPAPVAALALMIGGYACSIAGGESWIVTRLVAAGVIITMTGAHLISVAFSGRFQWVSTGLKVLLIIILSVCGFLVSEHQSVHFLPQSGDGAVAFGSLGAVNAFFGSLVYVLFAYSGWNAACYITGEVKNPERNVPAALLIGTGLVMILYIAVNAAMLWATPMDKLAAAGPGVAFEAATSIFGATGGRIMAGLIGIGLVSAISAMMWAGPRVSQQMGRDYPALGFLARTTAAGVPVVAVSIQGLLALLLVFTADVAEIINRTEFLLQVFLLLTVWGVVHLRIRQPNLTRPCRAWGYPWTTILFLLMIGFTMATILRTRPDDTRWGGVIVLVGVAFYWFAKSGVSPKPKSPAGGE